ncbi:MAG: hypothetical protein KDB82_13310 [Planctomycetes bacterium]|nr:hypothetical protein [Planctomycetota bacterium]
MKRAIGGFALIGLLLALSVPARAGDDFDLEKERGKLYEWLADKHADIGDAYKKVQIYSLARKQYDRARELEPDNRSAWEGLGYKKRSGEWVVDEPLPDKDGVNGRDFLEARKKPDEEQKDTYEKCARRCRKLMEKAQDAGDARSAKIVAIDLLYYEPDNAEVHKLRGHEKDGEAWLPGVAKKWRDAGHEAVKAATFGDEMEGEDEQAKTIGATFNRRKGDWLTTRTSYDMTRAKMLHRNGEATIARAQALLGTDGPPFGKYKYTITHLQSRDEYEGMLTKVLELDGDDLEFARRLSGHGQSKPYGYFCFSSTAESADDMLCNTIALRVLAHAQGGSSDRAPWIDTGFGYLVTSQVLGTTMVRRYTMKQVGMTASDDKVIPEFTKKSGTPELLREVALYNINYNHDIKLRELIATKINDMQQAHAAKSFSFMEFIYAEHPEQAKVWLKRGGDKKPEDRAKALEADFGKSVEAIEDEWREWVLMNY